MRKDEQIEKKEMDEIPTGFKLRHVLRGHKGVIFRIAWSPDGKMIASPSRDMTIRIWDAETGELLEELKSHTDSVFCVSWSPDSSMFASDSHDNTIQIWDTKAWTLLRMLTGHEDPVWSVSWSPDGSMLASGSGDKTVRIWDTKTWNFLRTLTGHESSVWSVSWSPDGSMLASGSSDKTVRIWDTKTWNLLRTLTGHKRDVWSAAWSPDGNMLASGSMDKTVRIWDTKSGQQKNLLEGHTVDVLSVSFSADGRFLASKGENVRLWRCDTWEPVAQLPEPFSGYISGLAFHPGLPVLATLGENDKVIRIWDLDVDLLLGSKPSTTSVKYTTAKIVLVGDSGVGKTGLGWRIAHGYFKDHSSTHGQQFWVIDEFGTKRPDGAECEAVLWDLAGQPDYRLVHSLFLDDVDLALVLFDPSNRYTPLSGVNYWMKQLKQCQKPNCQIILVGARADRGTPTLTEAELNAYCQQQGISTYISTSASKGIGLPELIEKIKSMIPWEEMTATITTTTFKRIKDYVLSLKEEGKRQNVLVNPKELRQLLERDDPDWKFTDDEMMTAVKHLETHGYVTILQNSRGDKYILLFPDLLTNLASSFVLEARRNPKGLGVIEENRLLLGEYRFPELDGLTKDEQEIMLDATAVLFLKHNICFREILGDEAFLVFPSLINEKRPLIEDVKTFEDVSYRVNGAVENVYASLVVLLGYTNTFVRTNQWQNQAQYEMQSGEICGFRQIADREGEIELILYYAQDIPKHVSLLFQGLFEGFLSHHRVEVMSYQPVICPKCVKRQSRDAIMDQLKSNENFIYCSKCGKKVELPIVEKFIELSDQEAKKVKEEQAIAERRTAFESALVSVKGLLRDRPVKKKHPTCFICYAWGVEKHVEWVKNLAKDMRKTDINALIDRWDNLSGDSISEFTDKIESSDYVLVIGTPELLQKYQSKKSDHVVTAELRLILTIQSQPKRYGRKIIPILLDGNPDKSFPPQLEDSVRFDFRDESLYFVSLLKLIWHIYKLPSDNPILEELLESMSLSKVF